MKGFSPRGTGIGRRIVHGDYLVRRMVERLFQLGGIVEAGENLLLPMAEFGTL